MKNDNCFGYIYKFTLIPTGKIYIGKREKQTFDYNYFGSGKQWLEAIKEYSKQEIKREVLCWGNSREELNSLERYYIKFYKSQDEDIGYNIHKGGQGGNSLNDHQLWSELHQGAKNGRYHKVVSKETREKIGNANRGKVRALEVKDRISKALKNKKKPDGFSEKISKAQKNRKKSEIELQHIREANSLTADKNRGKIIYNNGIREKRFYPTENIPVGYVRGRLYNENSCSNLPRNFHWYNNGVKAVYCENCPDGYKPGRKIK